MDSLFLIALPWFVLVTLEVCMQSLALPLAQSCSTSHKHMSTNLTFFQFSLPSSNIFLWHELSFNTICCLINWLHHKSHSLPKYTTNHLPFKDNVNHLSQWLEHSLSHMITISFEEISLDLLCNTFFSFSSLNKLTFTELQSSSVIGSLLTTLAFFTRH